jgi:hypothetical protein
VRALLLPRHHRQAREELPECWNAALVIRSNRGTRFVADMVTAVTVSHPPE